MGMVQLQLLENPAWRQTISDHGTDFNSLCFSAVCSESKKQGNSEAKQAKKQEGADDCGLHRCPSEDAVSAGSLSAMPHLLLL